MRLFFATDIHGSETCWRKFLNSGPHYDADVVILGGDMTGKALVPIVDAGDRERIESRASKLLERIEAADKSRAWRLRAKIGERKRWYEVPEEPRH